MDRKRDEKGRFVLLNDCGLSMKNSNAFQKNILMVSGNFYCLYKINNSEYKKCTRCFLF